MDLERIDLEARKRQWIGAIELIAGTVVVLAVLALAVWFVFFARHPLLHP
jgi:preprotein translocase subunit SecE